MLRDVDLQSELEGVVGLEVQVDGKPTSGDQVLVNALTRC